MIADKFCDEQALVNSYKALEKEFTKKCQELAKVKQELASAVGPEATDETQLVEMVEELPLEPVVENVIESGQEQVKEETPVVEEVVVENPIPTQNGQFNLEFRAKVNDFFNNFPEAKAYSREISKILLTDKSLFNCSDPFKVAYLLAKEKKGVEKEPEVLNVTQVEEKPVVPPAVSVLSSSIIGSAPRRDTKRYKSISEAGEEVIKRYF